MGWYEVVVPKNGKDSPNGNLRKKIKSRLYIFAEDASEVLKKYHKLPFLQKPPYNKVLPTVTPLSHERGGELEKEILEDGMTIEHAISHWYSP